MTEYIEVKTNLSNFQKEKIKKAIKQKIVLTLGSLNYQETIHFFLQTHK